MLINNLNPSPTLPLTGQGEEKKWGFSLVELLVVISIIAVLTSVLVANFMGMRERARDAQKIQDLNAIKSALRMYYNDKQSYPLTSVSLTTALVPTYIASVLGSTTYTSTGDEFKLSIVLETGAGDEDINSQAGCGIVDPAPVDKVFMVCAN